MALAWPFKDPDEVLDYGVDWDDRVESDEIEASAWSFATDPDGALVVDSSEFGALGTTVWLSGGTLGETYALTNHITTAVGREMDQTVKLKIKAK